MEMTQCSRLSACYLGW